jgi:hypothetical protein
MTARKQQEKNPSLGSKELHSWSGILETHNLATVYNSSQNYVQIHN